MKKIIAGAGVVIIIAIIIGTIFTLTKHSSNGSGHDMTDTKMISSNQNPGSPTLSDQVVIKNYAFGPKTVTVKKGTKVTWTNQDSDHHNVQPDQESADFKAGPLLGKNESYSFTFDKVGTYSYHCSPHPYMKATVEVTE